MSRLVSSLLPLLIGVAVVSVVAAILWPRDADPEHSVSIPYRAWQAEGTTAAPDVANCYAFDHARFLTATNADGNLISAEVVDSPGMYRMATDGEWYCEFEWRILVPESDHYLLTFSNGTRYVVDRDDLGDGYEAPWVELTSAPELTHPFASPAASPAVGSSAEG